ncbi:LytR C-terminal domain-containing protein [Lapillicoccus jejuensis]|uniref:LytR cell envelope-related transcriptional attenuator n=1 Tax=Lapillicoccus jejuensis TaxID=402171 RepID=A0A542DY70_9MICO|nr:LytR C-terminal domain-containing protein [Lapillicoccus jejuensis]TQJ07999.1 LytR cell envelope-related transcriptional attenuator [Lapillicoccus jejuensis]
MSYVVESASSRRARRRRRTAITLLVVVAMLAGAFYVASSYINRKEGAVAAPTPTTSCTTSGTAKAGAKATAQPAAAPKPSQVTVNVYNATSKTGLAGTTAKEVRTRGFVVGTVANDPLSKSVTGTGEIRFGKNGSAAATVVKAMLPTAAMVQDARADASVDLVLGDRYDALATPSTATTAPPC